MGKIKGTTIDTPAPPLPAPATGGEAVVVVFGKDDAGKPHASWFGTADAELAIKAAALMRMRVLPVTTDEHRAAASGLATGRIFDSGRGFVPFVKMAGYEAIAAFPEAYAPPPPVEAVPEPLAIATTAPATWADIGVGALVLAAEAPTEPWFPSVVVETKGEGLFVLRWRDFPDEASFVRRGEDLALLPPGFLATESSCDAPGA